ncbi:MAG: transcriptional regulator, TetR family, partial [Collimonas fungivorans]|uniref:TetR/AcrR family transcriptional regulator n=1 Tax=Collimonas fungivorans TaxID=158899 RepID=UPI0026ED6E2F
MNKATALNDTRATLLETGLRLFAEQGYNGTGIKEIVDATGVPKGSFYNYFKSKEDFGAEVISFYA